MFIRRFGKLPTRATFLEHVALKDRLDLRHKTFREWEGVYYVALWQDKVIGLCDAGVLRFHENQLFSEEQRRARI